MRNKRLWIAAGVLLAGMIGLRLLIRAASARPQNLGVTNGRLADCPATPNCVSTQATGTTHAIEPLIFQGRPEAAFNHLRSVVEAQRGSKLISATEDYLHFEFSTRWLGFLDDVEFLLDAENRLIHFRSASRLGTSDLGVNRRRMEAIRHAFAQPKTP